MDTSLFDFEFPRSLVAQNPAHPRDAARMLVLHRDGEALEHVHFRDLGRFLRTGDVLVINDTRVLQARLHGRRARTGGQVELLMLRPLGSQEWECLVSPRRAKRTGERVVVGETELQIVGVEETGTCRLRAPAGCDVARLLETFGETPLPPYIKHSTASAEEYQTVYAAKPGAAAAPTAGLHFTPRLMEELESAGIEFVRLTLHVGLGTFRPIAGDCIEDHRMHAEWYHVDADAADRLNRARGDGRRIIAVGTTAVRVLETVAADGRAQPGSGWTSLYIRPGHAWRMVDGLITNFHWPRTTLLVLVSAFAGRERVLAAYREAVALEYRLFSFGDAMLIL